MITFVTPNWPAPKQVRAYTTTRKGGVSQNNYSEFNLGMHVGDDPEKVLKNRELLKQSLNLPEDPRWINQTHSNLTVDANTIKPNTEADASYTAQKNVVCTVLTADCLPVLLCNKQGTEVASIHAGWRGLANHIIANTVESMQSPASDLMAWIGPAISSKIYEIGSEVKQIFTSQNSSYETCFREDQGKIFANLNALARMQISNLDIKYIYSEEFCTYTDEQRFYSARRNGINTGRMASLIWLTTEN